jgi:predicted RND superfamily exporter protein
MRVKCVLICLLTTLIDPFTFIPLDDPKEPNNNKNHELPRHDEFGDGLGAKWARMIHQMRIYTTRALLFLVHYAAVYPKICIVSCFCFSWFILLVGFFTNFSVEVENWYLWPPRNSLTTKHTMWFYFQSEFNYETSYFDMVVHAHGDNVLGIEGVRRTFEAIDAVRNIEGYKEGCMWVSMFGAQYHLPECKIHSVADFWNESLAIFEQQVSTDDEAIAAMSARSYPNGIYVDEARVLGNAIHASKYGADDDTFTVLESAQSYLIEFDLPWTNVTEDFEWDALQRIRELQQEWDADPNNIFTVEFQSQRSFGDEFLRSIIKDMPLLPFVFVIMSLFCCLVFWKRDRVHSRMLVGIGSVFTICLSVITGYGVLFCCGVPFTTVTTMMPFLMFGVGLDDSFIIYGSYNRLDPRLDPYERLRLTFEDVGLSISLTTLTSAVAFFMGVFSNIPAVSWVCWYAWPTVRAHD